MAKTICWQARPVDVSEIQAYADELLRVAEDAVDAVADLGGSPEAVARAVMYIERVHAIPPLAGDTVWFRILLHGLLEVAFPNTGLDGPSLRFLLDLQAGITTALEDSISSENDS